MAQQEPLHYFEAKGTIGTGARGRVSRPQSYNSWQFKVNQVFVSGVKRQPRDFVLKCSWKTDYFPIGDPTAEVSSYKLKLKEAPLCYLKVDTVLTIHQISLPWMEFKFNEAPTFYLRPVFSDIAYDPAAKFAVLFCFRGVK